MAETVWETEDNRKFAALRGREKADVAVIGGGLSGITTALWLSRAGLRVALAEAETIGYGASGHCAGILALGRGMRYAKMEESGGRALAEACAHTHMKAMQVMNELSTKQGLHFQLQETKGAVLAFNAKEAELLAREADAMKRAGLSAAMEGATDSPLPAAAALRLGQTYVLHSLYYLQALLMQAEALAVRLFEHSRVVAVETDVVYTETGSIQAPYIVIATGYPIVNTPGWYFLRMEQRSANLIRLAGGCPPTDVFFAADGSFALRPLGQGVLLQTNGRYVGAGKQENEERTQKECMAQLGMQQTGERQAAIETYTSDGLPYIGPYSSKTPNLFVAAGYGGDGLLGSMIAAQAISAQILGLPSDGYDIYSPQRSLKELAVPIHLGSRYMKGLIGGTESPRCSHMGCKLVFNASTRLWECPCHGSRFDGIGRVINAPAVHAAQLRGRK